jgi:hypothetical protein
MRRVYQAALVVSLMGLCASLAVHVRSLLGFGLHHWFVPQLLIFALIVPWMLAADDIVHGGITRWRRRPLARIGPTPAGPGFLGESFGQQQKWGEELWRNQPGWIKKLNYGITGYFFFVFATFFFRPHPTNTYFSGTLPAPIAFLFSAGWMTFCWIYFGTFWRALELDRER